MSQEILQLYAIINNNSTTLEDRHAATGQLLQIFKTAEAFPALFQIIHENVNIDKAQRQQAALAIRICLRNSWEELDQQNKGIIQQQILQSLSKETVFLIAKNVIESCELIFERDGRNWPELFQYIQSETPNELQLLIKMYLVTNIMKPLDDENHIAQQYFPLFDSLFAAARQTQNPEIIAAGCEMMGVLISFITPDGIQMCQPHLQFLMEYFRGLVPTSSSQDQNFQKVQYGFADALECDVLPIPTPTVVEFLIGLLQSPDTPKEQYASIFVVFQYLIKFHSEDLSENIDDILNILLMSGAATADVEEQSLANQDSDSVLLIAEIAGDFAGELQDPYFLKHLFNLTPKGDALTPSSLYSFSMILYNVIDESLDEVSHDIKPVVEIALQLLQSELLSIKEISTYIIDIIAANLHPSQSDLARKLLINLIPYLACENQDMIRYTFNPIISIFTQGFLPNDMLQPFMQAFQNIIASPQLIQIRYMCVEAIGQMIFAVEEDILPFAAQVFQMILQAGIIPTEDGNTFNLYEIDTKAQGVPALVDLIKQQSIIAYGMLLRFASGALQEQAPQILQNILSWYDSNNLEMCHSILLALGNLVIDRYPLLMEIRTQIIQMVDDFVIRLAQHQIDNGEYVNDEEDESGRLDILFGSFTDVLYLMEWIFKQYKELAPDSPTQWMATILMFMSLPGDESLQEAQQNAIRAGKYGTEMIIQALMNMSEEERTRSEAKNNPRYFELICELLQTSEYPGVVGECFSAMKFMLKKHIELDPAFLTVALEAGFAGIDGSLPCQRKRSLELQDSKKLFGFFKELAKNMPAQFPLQHYVDIGKKLVSSEKRELFDIAHYIKVTAFLFKFYQEYLQQHNLVQKFMLKNLIQAFQRYSATFTDDTEYAAFSVPPSALESMYVLLQINPKLVEAVFPNILELIKLILASEPSDDQFYSSTIAHAIQFLFVSKQVLGDAFDLTQWMPVLLPKLPLNNMGDEKLSQHIYPCIFTFLQDPTFVQTYGNDILRVFAQTLGRKERQFARYQFTSQITATLISSTRQLITMSGANENALQSFFVDDQQSYQRFMNRIQPSSS